MTGMLDSEKLQILTREVIRLKIANDFTMATKIAESLMAEDSRLSEGERYFKQVIFNKVTDDLIKWFAGNTLDSEIKKLHEEIEQLRSELADVRKTAIQAKEKAASMPSHSAPVQQQSMTSSAPQPEPEKKTVSVGAGPGRQELNPDDFDVSKIFNLSGGAKRN